jgi:hypothetical protein
MAERLPSVPETVLYDCVDYWLQVQEICQWQKK